jgi:1,4-dihydroxy-2-naphthoate octaprenyltransferase
MISRSSISHIRVSFSYFLMPVFFLALFSAGHIDRVKAWTAFFVLHFLLYPASNGFNSYYDRDTESIGTLKHPPAVTKDLLWLSLGLDAAALAIALLVGPYFVLGCLLYGCASKAYSWDKTRFKKYPVFGWLFTGTCQGPLTFLFIAVSVGTTNISDAVSFKVWFPALASGLFILGFYPLTQIFQHKEDARRHDRTISMLLGVRGTFYFTAPLLLASVVAFVYYLVFFNGALYARTFFFMLVPAWVYFIYWFIVVFKDEGRADFSHATRMCILSSSGINLFYVISLFLSKTA